MTESNLVVIGIHGPKQSGKDTLAAALARSWVAAGGSHVGREIFAGPLKAACALFWQFDPTQIEGDQKEVVDPRWGITPREAMQKFGTEYARKLCSHAHVRLLYERIDVVRQRARPLYGSVQLRIVTDLRFPNEFEMLRRRNAFLIHLTREGVDIDESHTSETALRDGGYYGETFTAPGAFDLRIHNEEGVEYLSRLAEGWVPEFLESKTLGRWEDIPWDSVDVGQW